MKIGTSIWAIYWIRYRIFRKHTDSLRRLLCCSRRIHSMILWWRSIRCEDLEMKTIRTGAGRRVYGRTRSSPRVWMRSSRKRRVSTECRWVCWKRWARRNQALMRMRCLRQEHRVSCSWCRRRPKLWGWRIPLTPAAISWEAQSISPRSFGSITET